MGRRTRALLLLVWLWPAAAVAATAPAQIVTLQGKGQYSVDGQSTWRPAAVTQALAPATYVRTLDLSKMGILLPDRTQMDLGPNSVAQITGAAEAATVRIPSGRVWSQSKSPPKRLVIETPSALAAIRGTEWEFVVDDEGRVILSVFSGEVELYNDLGAVLVRANEQARAEKGRAPVKLQVVVSRSRVQWVSAFRIEPKRYAEFDRPKGALAEIAARIREQELASAYALATQLTRSPAAPAVGHLLLADFEVYRGETPRAREVLMAGAAQHPSDARFDVAIARIALLEDDRAGAAESVRRALAKNPTWAEAWLAQGDIARLEGRADEAVAAYARAAGARAKDARPWLGMGIVESERENVGRARKFLETALALDDDEAGTRAELAGLEGVAGNYRRARALLEEAIARQPEDFVAFTGLGILELRTGHLDAAIDALLRASLIEPRFARAHLYLAAAYYQARRDADALAELRRAAELDERDPMPRLLASIIHVDRIEPGAAVEEARGALERIPYLKSLNPVANNQKGVANVGAPLAALGLEEWARHMAHESYLPFWGGSHLFLADRYSGIFNQRSELMQGFITDPLAFGASNRFQSLFLEPGRHATVAYRHGHSDDYRVGEATVNVNGHEAFPFPASYFAEAVDTRVDPGDTIYSGRARNYTAALGAKPVHEVGVFVYANRLSVDFDQGLRGPTDQSIRVEGTATRGDAGVRYAPDARNSLWLKMGGGHEQSSAQVAASALFNGDTYVQGARYATRPRTSDGAARFTRMVDETLELSAGYERSARRGPLQLVLDAQAHLPGQPVAVDTLDQLDRDRASTAYLSGRWGGAARRIEFSAAWSEYRKDRDIHANLGSLGGIDVYPEEHYQRRQFDPALGLAWRATPATLLRAACRRWLRPIALDTLSPVAIAGIPLDDQLVLPGGAIRHCRMQLEWVPAQDMFAAAHVEALEVRNLVSPLDGVQNARADVTNLDRLRNRAILPLVKPDLLEDTPVYGSGSVRRVHLAFERLIGGRIGARAHYTYSDSENDEAPLAGKAIPYVARHQLNLGITWAPGWRTLLTAQAIYRTRRYADEANAVELARGWDGRVNAFVESADKRWALELYAAQLLRKQANDAYGAVLSYRF